MEKVKVKVIKPYKDMEKMLLFREGEEHEVNQKRADELVKAGVAKVMTVKKNDAEQKVAGKEQ